MGSSTSEPSLRLIGGSTLLVAAGYAGAFLPGGPPRWSTWALLLGQSTLLVTLMATGARRSGTSLRALLLPLAATWLILVGSLGLALLLPPESPDQAFWMGLPRRAALVLYGVGLLPAIILPLAYARTFEGLTLRTEDLERIRTARARREEIPE